MIEENKQPRRRKCDRDEMLWCNMALLFPQSPCGWLLHYSNTNNKTSCISSCTGPKKHGIRAHLQISSKPSSNQDTQTDTHTHTAPPSAHTPHGIPSSPNPQPPTPSIEMLLHVGGLPHDFLVDQLLQLLLAQVVLVLVKVEELLGDWWRGGLVIRVMVRLEVWVL